MVGASWERSAVPSAYRKRTGVRARSSCGSVNVNEVPGYRTELTPFGGIKDSGLGVKEGALEAIRSVTNQKLYTLPWP
jgi:acyl-CoA reductase-like NAD-dependent aldehyde dehydrogenase